MCECVDKITKHHCPILYKNIVYFLIFLNRITYEKNDSIQPVSVSSLN